MTQTQRQTVNSTSSSWVRGLAVDPDRVFDLAELVTPMLAKAASRSNGRFSVGDILHDVAEREKQMWLVVDLGSDPYELLAVIVTELVLYPGRKVLQVQFLGGQRMAEWTHLISTLEDYARVERCHAVEFFGRAGWGRVFPGYSEVARIYEKEVCDG